MITHFWTQQLELQTEDFPQRQSLFAMEQNAQNRAIHNFYTEHVQTFSVGRFVNTQITDTKS
jgi:hypothetical protein